MHLTEFEAITKWCPFSRRTSVEHLNGQPRDFGGVNRNTMDQPVTSCIGARCMVWRWSTPAPDPEARTFQRKSVSWPVWSTEPDISFVDAQMRPEPPRPSEVPADWEARPLTGDDWDNADGGEWLEPAEAARGRYQAACGARLGFCGLAGAVAP